MLVCVLCWSSVPVFLRGLASSIDAWTANGVRYPLSALLFWPILLVAYRRGSLDHRIVLRCAIPALLAFCGQMLWGLAPYYLEASSISFFFRLSVVWSIIMAMILFADERRLLKRAAFYFGLLLTLGGFILMSLAGDLLQASLTTAGLWIITVCSALFGCYWVSVRWFLRDVHPLVGFGVVSQLVSIGTLTVMFGWGRYGDLVNVSEGVWVALIVSSVLGVAMGHVFLYTAVKRLGTAITSSITTLCPFVTAVMAAAVLKESLTPGEWLAGVTMVGGALILLHSQRDIEEPVPETERAD